jgi:hypothetical protein
MSVTINWGLYLLDRERAVFLYHSTQCNGVKLIQKEHSYIMVVNMSSSFWLLWVESRDFPQVEKERTACKDEQIHKMTTIFTKNGPSFFCVKMVVILWICSAFFFSLRKITWLNSQQPKTKGHIEHLSLLILKVCTGFQRIYGAHQILKHCYKILVCEHFSKS